MWLKTITICLLQLGTTLAYPVSGLVSGSTTGVHDPSLVRGPDGLYILVSTGTGIPIRTSTDRTNWIEAGSVFPAGAPASTDAFTGTPNGPLWAPDVSYHEGTFYLYYSASTFGSSNSAIFLATSATGLNGSWVDQGLVTSTSATDGWNAIDANLAVLDDNTWFLTAGSWYDGIRVFPVDPITHKPNGTAVRVASRGGSGIEAPILYFVAPHWYLFTSWDKCCSGLSSTYNIRVVRGDSPTGPFTDQDGVPATDGGGTLVMGSHGTTIGPGGQSILRDAEQSVLVYHWYDNTTSYLGLNLLDFTSGWPVAY